MQYYCCPHMHISFSISSFLTHQNNKARRHLVITFAKISILSFKFYLKYIYLLTFEKHAMLFSSLTLFYLLNRDVCMTSNLTSYITKNCWTYNYMIFFLSFYFHFSFSFFTMRHPISKSFHSFFSHLTSFSILLTFSL